jgi:hypothetical protein
MSDVITVQCGESLINALQYQEILSQVLGVSGGKEVTEKNNMKYFAVYTRENKIKHIHFLGILEDVFVNGVKLTGPMQAQTGARHFFDPTEFDNFYITKMEDLALLDSQIRKAVNDSNFRTY